MKKKFHNINRIFSLLSHPFVLLILGSFIFSSMIAEYNNISSRNMAVVTSGLIPASKAYLDCKADLQTAQNYYEYIRISLSGKNEALSNSTSSYVSIKHNTEKIDALERKIQVSCDSIYEILSFQADFLGIKKDFEKIRIMREEKNYSNQAEKLKLDVKISAITSNPYFYNLMENLDEYKKIIIELQFLETRRYTYEMHFYFQVIGLFENKLKEHVNKKIWRYLF